MVTIAHTLNLATELDEKNPIAQRLIALGDEAPDFLAKVFADFLEEEGILKMMNENNTWAKVVLA
jgi:hypothetical protein